MRLQVRLLPQQGCHNPPDERPYRLRHEMAVIHSVSQALWCVEFQQDV